MINSSSVSIPGVSLTSGLSPANLAIPNSNSSTWINKLKIVGNGQNWAVAPCEPFYLMGTESPTPDTNALTGAKNLIEHYGLENAYQKFCGRRVKEELSAFLPHLSGNVDIAASTDGSGLMHLIERPPIRGKDIRPFAPAHLEQAFRLHPGPLPQEYMSLFAAAPPSATNSTSSSSAAAVSKQHHFANPVETVNTSTTASANAVSRVQPVTALGSSGYPQERRRRRRYEVHRGLQAAATSGGGTPNSLVSNLTPPSAGFLPSSVTTSTGQLQQQQPQQPFPASAGRGTDSTRFTEATPPAAAQPPGLIHISASGGVPAPAMATGTHQAPTAPTPTTAQHPPPPLLAPVHPPQASVGAQASRLAHQQPTSDVFMGGSSALVVGGPGLPAPPLLHSIHNLPPPSSSSSHHHPTDGGAVRDWSLLHSSSPPPAIMPSSPLEGHNPDGVGGGGLQELPTLTVGDDERRRKRKEKRRRRDRE